MKRLDLNWGGFVDGITFRVKPDLRKNSVSEFVAQADIAKMRTGRVVTRDADGYVKVCDAADEVPMGLVGFGFLERLGTHEAYNAVQTGDGEGLTVAIGRFGTTIPLTEDYFDGDLTAVKAGQKIFSTEGKDGKMAIGAGSVEIGYVSLVGNGDVTIECKF